MFDYETLEGLTDGIYRLDLSLEGADQKFTVSSDVLITQMPELTNVQPQLVYMDYSEDGIIMQDETEVTLWGKWLDVRTYIEHPLVKINEHLVITGAFDEVDFLTRIHFTLQRGAVHVNEPVWNVLTVRVSVDNGVSYTEVEEVDYTTLSVRSIKLTLTPAIAEIIPSLIDRTSLTERTTLVISGSNLQEDTVVRITGLYPDGETEVTESE